MKLTLVIVLVAANLLVAVGEAAPGIDAQQSVGQVQQVDLPSISQLRFAIRKFNLPRGLECQVFATKVSPLVGQQQAAAASHQAQTDIPSQPKKVLDQLAHFIESQPAWDGFSSNSGKRILLEYINDCISSLDGATNPVVEVPIVTSTNEQQQTSKLQDEIELLRRQVVELEEAREVEAEAKSTRANQLIEAQSCRNLEEDNEQLKRRVAQLEKARDMETERADKKANELMVSYENQFQSFQAEQEELKRKLSASEEHCNNLLAGNTDTKDLISQLEMKVNTHEQKEEKCQRDYMTLKAQMDEQERNLLKRQQELIKDVELCDLELKYNKKCWQRVDEMKKDIEDLTSFKDRLETELTRTKFELENMTKKKEEYENIIFPPRRCCNGHHCH